MTLKELLQSDMVHSSLHKSNSYLNQGAAYLAIDDVTGLLNALFDGDWDFTILDKWKEEYLAFADGDKKETYFYIHGRLTIRTKTESGHDVLIKEDIGSNVVKKKDKSGRIDYSSGYKSAVSNALKGCAANLNIAVLKDEDVKSIRSFVAKKKYLLLKDTLGARFQKLLEKFLESHSLTKEDLKDINNIVLLNLYLEKNSKYVVSQQ